MADEKISGDLLAQTYPDEEWRRRFLEVSDLAMFFRHSIINEKYKISDDTNNAIKLTQYGTDMAQELTTKHQVPAKEARMMCFLELYHREALVNPIATDIEALAAEISSQITSRQLRHPYIFGRYLYNKAADLFPTMRSRLNTQETVRLLEGTPAGVFQAGRWVSGPLGLIESAEHRDFRPSTSLPLQHCSSFSCQEVHLTHLSTDYDASINTQITKRHKVLEPDDLIDGAWADFFEKTTPILANRFADFSPATLPPTVGDCFDVAELRQIASWLYREGVDPTVREVCRKANLLSAAENGFPSANDATLLQVIWAAPCAEIQAAIEFLIDAPDEVDESRKRIWIPNGEIRRPKINDTVYGGLRLRTEIGHLGVRYVSEYHDTPLLRLRALIEELYDLDKPNDRQQLQWQVRSVEGPDLSTRLAEFLRQRDPARVVQDLFLARPENVEKALDTLGLAQVIFDGGDSVADDLLVNRILWKLGFDTEPLVSTTEAFWRFHRELSNLLSDLAASSVFDVEVVKRVAGSLFRELEGVLSDSVRFTWWALTEDHVTAETRFTYREDLSDGAWAALDSYVRALPAQERTNFGGPLNLYPLMRSFSALALGLKALRTNPQTYLRDPETAPSWVDKTKLRQFPFKHTAPFLDLTEESQESIEAGLDAITKLLVDADVNQIRNSVSHFQRSPIQIERLKDALDATRHAVEKIEELGFARTMYSLLRRESDRWARSVSVMSNASGNEVSFVRPSLFDWAGLPSFGNPQYLVRSAIIAAPNEVLRFRVGYRSRYSDMWSGFPRRRRRQSQVVGLNAVSASDATYEVLRAIPTS